MTIDRNDPRWTAYVLNEMDPVERQAFEAGIEGDPQAEAILDEIREMAGLLEKSLEPEPLSLTADQRERIDNALPVAEHSTGGGVRFLKWASGVGIAAAVLMGIVSISIPSLLRSRSAAPSGMDTAQVMAPAESQTRPSGGGLATFGDREDAVAPAPDAVERESFAEFQRAQVPEAADADAQVTLTETPSATPPSRSVELSGKVTDEAGALIPGVQVTLTSPEGESQTTTTNSAGEYRFADVQGGRVELNAALTGFNTSVERFDVYDSMSKDVALEVGPMATAADVVSEPVGRTSQTGVLGGLLRSQQAVAEATPPPQPPAPAPPAISTAFRGGREQEGIVGGVVREIAEASVDELVNRIVDRRRREDINTEEYARITDNPFYAVSEQPLATFSADVDTASYANVRRFLNQRMLPPPDAVRIEEMINYFTYDYAPPVDGRPLRIHAEVARAPWATEHQLVRIGIQGRPIERNRNQPSNLVFLIDVSGSMDSPDKLPLLKEGMKLLVDQLGENDRVAIVVYAGASGLVLDSTPGDRQQRLTRALDRLSAGGSTNGGAGIELAYDTAVANFVDGGVNRVILATDGDFNVGVTNNGALSRLIEEKAQSGVFLSVLGFGTGNVNDAGMEALADRGNGNYAYIDSIREARKVLVEEMGSTLVTIAKDVKFQVEFNPVEVAAYRLIGYENRVLENQDFNNDAIDAGEIGAGHTVTALFEVVPTGVPLDIPGVDPLRYQTPLQATDQAASGELLTVKVRYKEPDADDSLLIEEPVQRREVEFQDATTDFRFAAAVAGLGMLLRESPYSGSATFDMVLDIAEASRGLDSEGYRDEFVELVRRARAIQDLGGNE